VLHTDFIEFDEDSCVRDGISDDISYNYEDITDTLKDVIDNWKELVSEQLELAEQLKEEFGLNKFQILEIGAIGK